MATRSTAIRSAACCDSRSAGPLPYGRTALDPVRALTAWLAATAITDGPVFRRIWVPPTPPDGPLPGPGSAPRRSRALDARIGAR